MPAVKETSSKRMNTFTIKVPMGTETNFLRTMSRNMGWQTTVRRQKEEVCYPALDRAIEEVRNGDVRSFDSFDDMMKYLKED